MEVPPRLFELLATTRGGRTRMGGDSRRIRQYFKQARYVHPKSCLTPLHLAIMAQGTDNNGAPVLAAIRSLLQSDPPGTEVILHSGKVFFGDQFP
jgi:hypothetical protein